MHLAGNIFAVLGAAYLAVVVAMFILQRRLIYFPVKQLGLPASYGFRKAEAIEITTEDGHVITGWYAPPSSRKETIVYFHGNKGNIGNRAHKLIGFAKDGYGVLAVSWRGYGTSGGKPHEKGLLKDARAAIEWLAIPHEYIILYGESLGSGIPVLLTMLEAPYASMINMARKNYPWLPVQSILRDKFDSIRHIGSIQSPLLIIHGEADEIIPVANAKLLFEAAPEPKRLVLYPHAHHTDFSMEQILKPLADYILLKHDRNE
jgi:fermentation-respiration switch protein FrsA (DUF1100 family)